MQAAIYATSCRGLARAHIRRADRGLLCVAPPAGRTLLRDLSSPICRATQPPQPSQASSPASVGSSTSPELVGEEAARFVLAEQKLSSWVAFSAVLAVVMAILYAVWIQPGFGLADDYVAWLKSFSSDPEVVIVEILLIFALFHSGLAGLRPWGEQLIGERAYRVLFASISLPLAVVAVFYFINHRYDGTPLWNVRGVPGVHEAVWVSSLVSFFFLYPSTFNLLEVAAVDKPKLHLWETGIMRITRHPQVR